MEEGKPLAKDLRFVILLDPQSLSCVDRSETLLQFVQGILVHGIICLRKWLDFPCGHRPRQTPHTVYSLRPNSLFYRTTWFICTPVIPGGRNEPMIKSSHHSPGTLGTCFPGALDTIRTCVPTSGPFISASLDALDNRTPDLSLAACVADGIPLWPWNKSRAEYRFGRPCAPPRRAYLQGG